MILSTIVGIVASLALTLFVVVGFAAFSMAWVLVSGDDLEELQSEDKEDLVVRIGSALESILKMPYSHFSMSRRPEIRSDIEI